VTVLVGVIGFTVVLLIVVVVAIAREPGPGPTDVAIGYVRAAGSDDFDAMYRMIDPDLMRGRNRVDWIAEQRSRPHLAFDPNRVHAVRSEIGEEEADVDVAVDADRIVPVALVLRSRVWVVTTYDGASAVGRARR
jgi:hypothetical protein